VRGPTDRLIEERIRNLCQQAINAREPEVNRVVKELKLLVQMHTINLRPFIAVMPRRKKTKKKKEA